MALRLFSPDFEHGNKIPATFTCRGNDSSPPLHWNDAPAATKSLALVCSDPDAPGGVFQHWAAYDIPADWSLIVAGYGILHPGHKFKEGINDFGNLGYGGPCPPVGHGPHRYFFRLSALSVAILDLPADAKCVDVIGAVAPVTIETSEWMGTFERK